MTHGIHSRTDTAEIHPIGRIETRLGVREQFVVRIRDSAGVVVWYLGKHGWIPASTKAWRRASRFQSRASAQAAIDREADEQAPRGLISQMADDYEGRHGNGGTP